MTNTIDLPYAHGGPPLSGRLRASPEDFRVEEELGFEPSGTGEHVFVRVEKRGANTEWVARQLAAFAGVAPLAVSYAGLKDRHALTRQTFSLQLPGKADPDWSTFAQPDMRILNATRHSRKLKRGALTGNRFRIVLRELSGEREQAEQRIDAIRRLGVPNYFGEQRFGRGGDNVAQARAMFAGRRVPRHLRGLLLSAARSQMFNALLAERVRAESWHQALDGEVWMLDGSHSVFGPEPFNDSLRERLARADIHPTGVLWGRGELRSAGAVRELEQSIATTLNNLATGLEQAGLEQERRALRLSLRELRGEWLDDDALALEFFLPAGTYATSVVREICRCQEAPTSANADDVADAE